MLILLHIPAFLLIIHPDSLNNRQKQYVVCLFIYIFLNTFCQTLNICTIRRISHSINNCLLYYKTMSVNTTGRLCSIISAIHNHSLPQYPLFLFSFENKCLYLLSHLVYSLQTSVLHY